MLLNRGPPSHVPTINSCRATRLTASLEIFALIAFEFRSLRVGLIAAVPNLTPLTVTLGYMGLWGYTSHGPE